jgi:hypothetical protein
VRGGAVTWFSSWLVTSINNPSFDIERQTNPCGHLRVSSLFKTPSNSAGVLRPARAYFTIKFPSGRRYPTKNVGVGVREPIAANTRKSSSQQDGQALSTPDCCGSFDNTDYQILLLTRVNCHPDRL